MTILAVDTRRTRHLICTACFFYIFFFNLEMEIMISWKTYCEPSRKSIFSSAQKNRSSTKLLHNSWLSLRQFSSSIGWKSWEVFLKVLTIGISKYQYCIIFRGYEGTNGSILGCHLGCYEIWEAHCKGLPESLPSSFQKSKGWDNIYAELKKCLWSDSSIIGRGVSLCVYVSVYTYIGTHCVCLLLKRKNTLNLWLSSCQHVYKPLGKGTIEKPATV